MGMELPFLKNKQKNQGGGVMSSDGGGDLMDAVTQELFTALEKKDIKAFREALEALVLHIGDKDEQQDEEMMP